LDFLQKTWLKNVIFVLQQIDLREPTEIDVIHRHLQDTAMRRLGFVPPIFAVSARKALLARTSGLDKEKLWEESAFAPLEEQINFIVTESSTRMLKLRSTFQAARVALEDLNREIRGFLDKISADTAVLDRLDGLLATRREQMLRQTTTLVREVERAYDETTKDRAQLLRQSQSWWRSFNLIWRRTAGQQELHSKLETQLRQLMQPQMEKAIRTLEADLRGLWPQMQDLLENQLSADLLMREANARASELNAALDANWVPTRGDKLQTFAINGLGEQRGGGGAIAGVVAGFAGDFTDHLSAHVFASVLEFDFLGDHHPVFGHGRSSEFPVKYHIPALGTECGFHCATQFLHSAEEGLARCFVKNQLF